MSIHAQIPNASFENWVIENNFETPEFWHTNNYSTNFTSVSKVDYLTEGNFAMKVKSNGPSFEGKAPGYAYCTFLPNAQYNFLELSYRIDLIVSEGSILVIVSQFEGADYKRIGTWTSETMTTQIEQAQLPFKLVNNDSVKVEIFAATKITSLGYEGYSEVIVDGMHLDIRSGIDTDVIDYTFQILPNPTSGMITIQGGAEIRRLTIRDAKGSMVKKVVGNTRQLDLSELSAGNYYLTIETSTNEIFTKKIVKTTNL